MSRRIFFTVLLLSISYFVKSQLNLVDAPTLFQENNVPRIDISINPDSLDILINDITSSHEYIATMVYNNYNGVHDTIENIGFKLRGNGSRSSSRKSYRVSFNSFSKGRKFLGYEKMNLKATQDDSFIRPKLCWFMFREMGIPASWMSHVMLFVNNTLWGVYANVEHIDEIFIKRNFENNQGNLYKCRYPSALKYINDNPYSYKLEHNYYGDRSIREYELKINEEIDDYTDLMQLTDVLNNTNINDLSRAIKHEINVSQLMKFFALEVYLGHWDSYSGNGNNYYLYNNTATGKFEYIPTDMDFTLGIMFGLDNRSDMNIYNWFGDIATFNGSVKKPPLRHRLLSVDEFKSNYTFYLKQLMATFPPDSVRNFAEKAQNFIYPYLEQDPSFSYSKDDYFGMLDNPTGANYGIIQFLQQNYTSILSEVDNSNTSPIFSKVKFSKYNLTNPLKVSCVTEDEDENLKVMLFYTANGYQYDSIEMDKLGRGKLWGSLEHNLEFSIDTSNHQLDFYLETIDSENQTSRSPHEGLYTMFLNPGGQKLLINECMASNDNSITDEFGNRDDWVELYNADSKPVNLANKFLSDEYSNSDKWQLPDITLQAGEFVWFWADKELEQGNKHADFKLSSDGETVYLFEEQDLGTFMLLDSFSYPAFDKNTSYGRLPDGTNNFTALTQITPGHPNDSRGLAFSVFELEMNQQIEEGNFIFNSDVVDVIGDFNSWNGSPNFSDSNKDGIYTYTEYDLVENQQIEYRFRINKDNDKLEFPIVANNGENRIYTLKEGCNNLSHIFNTEEGLLNQSPPANTLSQISIYPNPAIDMVYISSSNIIKELQIIDMHGRVIKRINDEVTPELGIPIGSLPKGIYVIKLMAETGLEFFETFIKM